MRRLGIASILLSAGAFAACSGDEVAPSTQTGTGGTLPTSGSSSSGTAGTAPTTGGSAGTDASGGTAPVTGGSAGTDATGGTAGTVATGGTAGTDATGGTAGTDATGGTAGTDATGGTAGTDATGGTAGDATGGMPQGGAGAGGVPQGGAGAGGMPQGGAGAGGAPQGGAGAGGTPGGAAGAAGGGNQCPTVAQLFPAMGNLGSLDGRLVTTPCQDTNSDDCTGAGWVYNGVTTPCSGGRLQVEQDFTVGGTPGAMYMVTMHFYGIMEPKNYGSQVTRESGSTRPTNNNTGATPVPWAYTTSAGAKTVTLSDYNTYEIHVFDNNNQVYRQYFLNSDTQEGHWTYVIDYEKTIPVIGGGKIRWRQYDNNCRMIKNCYNGGQGNASQCEQRARSVTTVTNANPPPTGLQQPGLGRAAGQAGQWVYTDVVSVACQ